MLHSNMQIQNINDVVARLDKLILQSEVSQNKAGYFSALYKRMTVAVAEGIAKKQFEDGARMEQLDIAFARRYFDAYDAYHAQLTCTAAWRNAFDAGTNDGLIVLQHLLLGINTHINLDLAIAAASVAPGANIVALQNDFNRINAVIASLVGDMQEALSQVWWPMRMLTKIANGKQDAVLNFSIDKARATSWANAVMLANMNSTQQAAYIQQMDTMTKLLGDGIKTPGGWSAFVLRSIRKTEYNDVARTIRLIDTTVV